MAVTRYPAGAATTTQIPTIGHKVLTAAVALATAAFIVLSESVSPVPLAMLACALVASGFGFGIYAWATKAEVDRPHTTAWDLAGTQLFAGFALATALGSSWMGV